MHQRMHPFRVPAQFLAQALQPFDGEGRFIALKIHDQIGLNGIEIAADAICSIGGFTGKHMTESMIRDGISDFLGVGETHDVRKASRFGGAFQGVDDDRFSKQWLQ